MLSKITQIYYLICTSTQFFTLATARDLFRLDCRYDSQDPFPCPQGAGKQPSNRLRKTSTYRQQTGSWYLLGSFPTRVEFSCSKARDWTARASTTDCCLAHIASNQHFLQVLSPQIFGPMTYLSSG